MTSELTKTIEFFKSKIVYIAIIAQLQIFLEIYRVAKTENSVGLSVTSYVITLLLSTMWLVYAFIAGFTISKITSSIAIIGALMMLFFIFKYREPEDKELHYPTEEEINDDPYAIIKKHRPEVYAGHNTGFVIINKS